MAIEAVLFAEHLFAARRVETPEARKSEQYRERMSDVFHTCAFTHIQHPGAHAEGDATQALSALPDRQSVTVRIEVSVLEPGRIFQSESQHPVETNVGDPDDRELPKRLMVRYASVSR
jgi:hypothetical protein